MNGKVPFSDLVARIAQEAGTSVQRVHDCLVEAVRLNGEDLGLQGRSGFPGLGHFALRWHEARQGRNPQTGETLAIPAHNHIHFSPEAPLRTFINRRYARLKVQSIKEKKEGNRWHWPWLVLLVVLVILLILFRPRTWMGQPGTPVAPVQTEEVAEPAALTAAEPVADAAVETPVAPAPIAPVAGIASANHTVEPGDNLWALSQIHFGGAEYWPLIYQANTPPLDDPDLLPVGVSLRLPSLEGQPLTLTSSDVERLAQAHVAVYTAYRRFNSTRAVGHLWTAWHLHPEWVEGQNFDADDLARARRMPGKPELD